ncbi:ABC transporter permease [Silicimonas algicola]|uniref:Putative spermidine/putrescine transport system permease protein n=1 Tax=Silicimonas algicola TaxID=1826607 RepID=A0A316G3X5_9RHOB|nr:ABC transporter permease [Silicimonas algicola]AZQ69164.1 ABC transporter permease [Silicimonas algicola]PWK55025.1 putative spermidine/putrescine transport system permease protein [Silicimonas algicola]
MTDAATGPDQITGATPDNALRTADRAEAGPVLSADGTPLKTSLNRALRREKMRALLLVSPLLIFILVTFIAPIADMLFRSVENRIVADTLPQTVAGLDQSSLEVPGEPTFEDLYFDLFLAAEAKKHTQLGTRLNYESAGVSSLFRSSGRRLDDIGEETQDALEDLDESWGEAGFWYGLMNNADDSDDALLKSERARVKALTAEPTGGDIAFAPSAEIAQILPRTTRAYTAWAVYIALIDDDVVAEEEPWEAVYAALGVDLERDATLEALATYAGPGADQLRAAAEADLPSVDYRAAFVEMDDGWGETEVWNTLRTYSSEYTIGYFLNAIDLQLTPNGIEKRPDRESIYLMLFQRTLVMSLIITISCIILGYPIAWLLANLPMRSANLLMILVLLPFWTSLLVRTSAWKILLQQQGVINDLLVWIGIVSNTGRLVLINNQTGTIIAMTHILLPFMILPLYSVMKTIPVTYVRAAKSLGATDWTAFWRVYFPNSVPGIGAGSILVFILSIGYYITPELVGGTSGVFISNRIAYHISSSLNWGLAAALGTILLAAVLMLYYTYDRMVGIDNVKLGG